MDRDDRLSIYIVWACWPSIAPLNFYILMYYVVIFHNQQSATHTEERGVGESFIYYLASLNFRVTRCVRW